MDVGATRRPLSAQIASEGVLPVLARWGALGSLVAILAGLASANGGFFPASWGWATLTFTLLAAPALVVVARLPVRPLDGVYLGSAVALTLWVGLSALWSRSSTQSVLETERTTLYAATALAVLVLVRLLGPRSVLGAAAIA